ncbi:hypothetical protein BS78_09G253600 [Paspalum vaginatum]|nr:hypothetical protein BS78_09G253600 [Paspalum vaginatum]
MFLSSAFYKSNPHSQQRTRGSLLTPVWWGGALMLTADACYLLESEACAATAAAAWLPRCGSYRRRRLQACGVGVIEAHDLPTKHMHGRMAPAPSLLQPFNGAADRTQPGEIEVRSWLNSLLGLVKVAKMKPTSHQHRASCSPLVARRQPPSIALLTIRMAVQAAARRIWYGVGWNTMAVWTTSHTPDQITGNILLERRACSETPDNGVMGPRQLTRTDPSFLPTLPPPPSSSTRAKRQPNPNPWRREPAVTCRQNKTYI